MECFACNTKTNEYYIEEIYFKETGRMLCKTCLDKHCAIEPHYCCQDFKVSGKYAHYNLPVIKQ